MQFVSLLTVLATALASGCSTVPLPSTSTQTLPSSNPSGPPPRFGLVAIHPGTTLQNVPIKKPGANAQVFLVGNIYGEPLTVNFDGTYLVDQDGVTVKVDQGNGYVGDVAPDGRQAGTAGFGIENGLLTFNGSPDWNGCPYQESSWALSKQDCPGAIGITLKVVSAEAGEVREY